MIKSENLRKSGKIGKKEKKVRKPDKFPEQKIKTSNLRYKEMWTKTFTYEDLGRWVRKKSEFITFITISYRSQKPKTK